MLHRAIIVITYPISTHAILAALFKGAKVLFINEIQNYISNYLVG